MNLVSNYKTVTIETAITAKDLKTIKTHAPEALRLVDEDKHVYFAIGVSKVGSISKDGIDFDGTTKEGTLYVSVHTNGMPNEDDNRRTFLEEQFGATLVKLAKIEQQVAEALTAQATAITAIADSITII